MSDQHIKDYIAGYEVGKRDAIRRCLMERVSQTEPGWREHNGAIRLAVAAIRALVVGPAFCPMRAPGDGKEKETPK